MPTAEEIQRCTVSQSAELRLVDVCGTYDLFMLEIHCRTIGSIKLYVGSAEEAKYIQHLCYQVLQRNFAVFSSVNVGRFSSAEIIV